jgi:hydroxymethylpyrimidine/phosphomethylpyrimidine kinase
MAEPPPVVLTIAGFDPSSGAGATADLKTIAAHGCYGIACLTALTVQSSKGVRRVIPVDEQVVRETLEELASDVRISAVHIGMLGKQGIVGVVGDFLAQHEIPNVVLDPVLRSSLGLRANLGPGAKSDVDAAPEPGAELLDALGAALLVEKLLPLVTVITPNLDEAAALTGLPVTNLAQMRVAVEKLHQMGAKAVVITGGHLDPATDLLSCSAPNRAQQQEFTSAHLRSPSTHGTGCAFATALACRLAGGTTLPEAVRLAKDYVEAAIAHAYPMGKGIGPINHLYRFQDR